MASHTVDNLKCHDTYVWQLTMHTCAPAHLRTGRLESRLVMVRKHAAWQQVNNSVIVINRSYPTRSSYPATKSRRRSNEPPGAPDTFSFPAFPRPRQVFSQTLGHRGPHANPPQNDLAAAGIVCSALSKLLTKTDL